MLNRSLGLFDIGITGGCATTDFVNSSEAAWPCSSNAACVEKFPFPASSVLMSCVKSTFTVAEDALDVVADAPPVVTLFFTSVLFVFAFF